jgi:hypothetical protein
MSVKKLVSCVNVECRGGIFRFETTDGRIVRSSFCHGETKH